MIKNRIYEYERQITEEIRQDNNKLWLNINKLKAQKPKRKLELYHEDGTKITENDKGKEVVKYWSTIYRMHDNEIEKVWSERERAKYERLIEKNIDRSTNDNSEELDDNIDMAPPREGIRYPAELREHMDMVMRTDKQICKMRKKEFEIEEVKTIVMKLRKRKSSWA